MSKYAIHICTSPMYRYGGFTFEVHSYCGPHPLKKDLDPMRKIPSTFWVMWTEFDKLTKADKETYRV